MTRRYFQPGNGFGLDIPVLVAMITARVTAVPFAVVVGGRSPRKAHGQRKALTVASTTIRKGNSLLIVKNALIAGAVVVAVALNPALLNGQQSPRQLFERARIVEEANQDLMQAIRLYEQAAAQAKGDRALGAQALLRAAESYQKLGNRQAASIYERLVRDYADQKEAAAQARERLAALEPRTSARHEAVMANRRVWSGADVDTQGAVSTGGLYLTHLDLESGDLAIRNLETGEKRRLTHNTTSLWDEFTEASFPSVDGRLVAYEWYKDDSYELRVVSVTGENETVKTRTLYRNKEVRHIQPAGWSPESKSILAYLSRRDGTHQIALIDVSDGSVQVLKSLDWRSTNKLSLSPDGRYVAYDFPANEDSPEHDIYLLATDGSREVRIVEHPGDDLLLGWVPDGQAILFASDRTGATDIWKLPVAAGKPIGTPVLVKRDIGRITPLGFSATGAFYYGSESGIRDVYTVPIDPKSLEPLAAPALVPQRFLGTNQRADWSADGKFLAYASRRGQAWDSPSLICIRSVETGVERQILPKLAWINSYGGSAGPATDATSLFRVRTERAVRVSTRSTLKPAKLTLCSISIRQARWGHLPGHPMATHYITCWQDVGSWLGT